MTSPPDPDARPDLPSGAGSRPPPDAGPVPATELEARYRETRRGEKRALRWGLAISVAVHVVAILLYPVLLDRADPETRTAPERAPQDVMPGIEVIVMRDAPDSGEEEPEDPIEIPPELPDPDEPEPDPDPAAEPDPDGAPDPDAALPRLPVDLLGVLPEVPEVAVLPSRDDEDLTVGERLRPRPGDPRLWAWLDPEVGQLTDQERAELLLEGIIETWNDSVAVAAALSQQQSDWTYVDSEGRRWGLSPGRLHLGDFSVPLPVQFDVPAFHRDRVSRRDWEIQDILRQATTAEIRETWSERAREIRERMDAERDRARQGGGGGP